jgi:gamma-glutamyl-gamma-aminobutyrate hydrolase PuuD
LTTYLAQSQTGIWDVQASFLPAVYFQGVTAAGGVAVLLPPQPVDPDIAERVLDSLDALLVTGGRDIDPAAYGQQSHPATDEPGPQRDAWEFTLLHAALKRQVPVLGICRGLQIINTARGGTLQQHLPDSGGPGACKHSAAPGTRCSPRCQCAQYRAPGWPGWSVNPSTRGAITIRPSPNSARAWLSAVGMPMV